MSSHPPLLLPNQRLDDYDGSSSDSCDTARLGTRSRLPFRSPPSILPSPAPSYLQPSISGRSSLASSPVPSRSTSPLPSFFSAPSSSTCTSSSEYEDEEPVPILMGNRHRLHRDQRTRWWYLGTMSTPRRRRGRRIIRTLKRWTRHLVRHPLFPRQPTTIILTLILLSIFATSITFLIMHILNPDKEPLPWRSYCSKPSSTHFITDLLAPAQSTDQTPLSTSARVTRPPFPPNNLEDLPPAGLFIGVFSVDSAFERRMLVRTTWASHARSRAGAGEGDGGIGTSRSVVRFILGQPRKAWERRIKLEMEMYNDIIILPVAENMNSGKTHTFFSWAYLNAWVPPVYTDSRLPPPRFSYSEQTSIPPTLAPHDPVQAWDDQASGEPQYWVRPDYVVKADDDAFVMLAELESRLRIELHTKLDKRGHPMEEVLDDAGHLTLPSRLSSPSPPSNVTADPLVYWGYLVQNRFNTFMAGELYSLSWSLTEWIAKSPEVKTLTKGAEDKQTAKWMKIHPQASRIRWVTERCWMYDHPRSGTVYAHGFLFPSEATRVKRAMIAQQQQQQDKSTSTTTGEETNGGIGYSGVTNVPTPSLAAWSSVSTWGVRYTPPLPDMKTSHSVEALVEGSEMSTIREGSAMTPDYAWVHREGRLKQYENKRVGGTIVVHFIKKNLWFLETALALLEGEDYSESEKLQMRDPAQLELSSRTLHHSSSSIINRTASRRILR